ncbi:MAG: hypothetical protein HYR83_06565 [Planctomycetes bacterium]|nr:hypothetical protein [Planctomycetota bacterium]
MIDHGLQFGWDDIVVLDLNMNARRLTSINEADVDVACTLKEELVKCSFLKPKG